MLRSSPAALQAHCAGASCDRPGGPGDRATGDDVQIDWFKEAGRPPSGTVEAEVGRLSAIVGRGLRAKISLAA